MAKDSGPWTFSRIPTVLSAQELLDSAFHRASRITVWVRDPFERLRGTEIARVRSVQNGLDAALAKYVSRFPSFDNLPPFYRDLAGILVDVGEARQSLAAVGWARQRLNAVANEAAGRMRATRREDVIREEKRAAYGRISSILYQIEGNLVRLNGVRDALRRLPTVDTEVPTIVVAGYPNVGKSSLIRRVSTGEPEVAAYPFTTKGIVIGHFDVRRVRYQIIDTPGVLDRPIEERNAIERQAIAAFEHLADALVFLLDPSQSCGYPLADQERLLEEVRTTFADVPLLVAENKVDLARTEAPGRLRVSTETGEGVAQLMEAALAAIRPVETRVTQ